MTEDDKVGWHHNLNGHEFEQTLGDSEEQGSLECCSSWGFKELDMTQRWNNNNLLPGLSIEAPSACQLPGPQTPGREAGVHTPHALHFAQFRCSEPRRHLGKVLYQCRTLAGLPRGSSGKVSVCQCRRCKIRGFDPWVGKIPRRRA